MSCYKYFLTLLKKIKNKSLLVIAIALVGGFLFKLFFSTMVIKKKQAIMLPLKVEIPFSIKSYKNNQIGPNDPRFIIVTHFTLDNKFLKYVIRNHNNYAKFHGYDYWFRNGIINASFVNLEIENKNFELVQLTSLYWQKIEAIWQAMNLMENGKFKYEWIFWIDGDAIFTNFSQSLENLIKNVKSNVKDYLIISKDISCGESNSCYLNVCLNSGVFLVRNNTKGRAFINSIINSYNTYKNDPLNTPEQNAIIDHVFNLVQFSKNDIINTELKYNNKCTLPPVEGVRVIDAKMMNSGYNNKNPFTDWTKGDFIVHFAGVPNKKREKLIPWFLNCIEAELNNCHNYDW